jgi:hypothetical protein
MKLFVHHDATGAIHSIVTVHAPERVGLMLTPAPGLFVAEIEGTKVKPGVPDVEELRKIAKTHEVATPNRCKLTKKK